MPDQAEIDFLDSLDMFSALDEAQRKALYDTCQRVELAEGEVLFNAGDPPGKLYVVEDGWMNITVGMGAKKITVAEVGPGAMIGEMGEFAGKPRSAAAEAAIESVILALDGPLFVKAVIEHPPAALKVLQILGERIANANRLVQERGSLFG